MAKSARRRRRANEARFASRTPSPRPRRNDSASGDTIKAAEEVAIAAFSSGLRLAAAFGTAAAKTASLALASLATGADTFSELVKKEAMGPNRQRKHGPTVRKAGKSGMKRKHALHSRETMAEA